MRARRRLSPARVAAIVAVMCAVPWGPIAAQQPLGTQPTYTSRTLSEAPNAQAIVARIWAPGLDDGYVPQGVTVVGRAVYVGAYLSTSREVGRGPCRLFQVDPATGRTTGQLDLPSACGHLGGLARGPTGHLYAADTRTVFIITLQDGAGIGTITTTIALAGAVKGSFAAGTADALWLGSYERDGPGALYRIPHAALQASAQKQSTISERDATASIALPPKTQGAAFDGAGRLWITRSGATFGELLLLDAGTGAIQSRYAMPDGIEDLSFDAAGFIWTLSEAGSRRWNSWKTFQPILFQLDPRRLAH